MLINRKVAAPINNRKKQKNNETKNENISLSSTDE